MGSSSHPLSAEEIERVRESWKRIIKQVGMTDAGLAILQQLFTDVPETLKLFYNIGIGNTQEEITIDYLKENKKVKGHALRITTTIAAVIKNLENEAEVEIACRDLGKKHKKNNVPPEYFDKMAGVLMKVITGVEKIEMSDPIASAWVKVYGIISTNIKLGIADCT